MPIYDYHCNSCGRSVSLFFKSFSQVREAVCPSCQSPDLSRLISRVAIVRSESRRVQDIEAEQMLSDLDPTDKSSIIRWAKKVGREVDEEIGAQFLEMAERVEGGEEHFGLTVDPDYTFRYKLEEAKAKARGELVEEEADPWKESPTAPKDDISSPSEL